MEPEKKTKQKRQPAKKIVEIKPDPEEYTIRTRDISDSESETEPIEPEPIEPEPEKKKNINIKREKATDE